MSLYFDHLYFLVFADNLEKVFQAGKLTVTYLLNLPVVQLIKVVSQL